MKIKAGSRLKATEPKSKAVKASAAKVKIKSNSIKRLRASLATRPTKVCAVELPKFRYIDDVNRFLSTMSDEIDDLEQVIRIQQKQLAKLLHPKDWVHASLVKAATFEFNISPDAGAKRSHLKRKIDPELTKVVVPEVDKLKEQYGLSEDLYEKHRTLEAVETQLAMQFPDKRGPAYEEAIKGIRALKAKVDERLKEVLGFLNQVASEHVPKTFKKYMDAVVQEVQEHVMFEKNQVFLYVSTKDNQIVFTYYLMLENALNDEGQVTPHLYISLQWVVGESLHVQINHEYELPAQLMRDPGTSVDSVGAAVKAISHLLEMEEFSTALGTVPLATQLKMDPSKVTENMFTYRSFIDKLSIDSDKLVFELRKGVTEEQANEIKYPLFQEVKSLFKNSRTAKLTMQVSTKAITFMVKQTAKKGEVDVSDAEFLKDKFNINDTQLRKVVNILNQGVEEPKQKQEREGTQGENWNFKPGQRGGEEENK
jgi:hypothetical protein